MLNEEKWFERVDLVRASLSGKIKIKDGARQLRCGVSTFKRYKALFIRYGAEGLKDKRGGNYRKLTPPQKEAIKGYKQKGPWRSARKVRDDLNLPVHT